MKTRCTRMMMVLGVLILLAAPAAVADSYTFSLIPADGAVAGPPGSTVGWGYSIINTSPSDWLVTTALSSDAFLNGTPAAIFDFPDLGPGVTGTVPFDPIAPAGLFELTWDITAPVGFVNSGSFDLSAEFWSGDPLAGGVFVASAPDTLAPYTATVTPEPPTLVLLLGALTATGILRRLFARIQR
jgi:hypothetical protein